MGTPGMMDWDGLVEEETSLMAIEPLDVPTATIGRLGCTAVAVTLVAVGGRGRRVGGCEIVEASDSLLYRRPVVETEIIVSGVAGRK